MKFYLAEFQFYMFCQTFFAEINGLNYRFKISVVRLNNFSLEVKSVLQSPPLAGAHNALNYRLLTMGVENRI